MKRKARLPLNWAFAVAVAFACLATSCAQYRLLPGAADSDGCLPTTPARICLGTEGTEHCYAPASTKDYIFGLEPTAKHVGQLDGKDLTLFTAMFYGCGSGTLTDFSLLTIRGGEFIDLFPAIRLTNQSEHKFWRLPNISNLPVWATAEFIWDFDAGETHFSPHRYAIEVYVFDPKANQYVERAAYKTKRKYPGLDDMDQIKVLEFERPTILASLK